MDYPHSSHFSSDSDDSDESELVAPCPQDESEFIIFDQNNVEASQSTEAKSEDAKSVRFQLKKQYLVIQMEFCENRTLRRVLEYLRFHPMVMFQWGFKLSFFSCL